MTGVAAAAPAVPPAALEPLFSRLEARALFACGGACRAWAAAAERELERRCAQQRWRLPGSRRQLARLGSRPWRALYESKACKRCLRTRDARNRGLFHVRDRQAGGVSVAVLCAGCITGGARDALDARPYLVLDTLSACGHKTLLSAFDKKDRQRGAAAQVVRQAEAAARASGDTAQAVLRDRPLFRR